MMGNLPFGIDNRSLAHFDDAVACGESGLLAGTEQIDMSPLIPVIMNIIGDLAQQDTIVDQNPPRLGHERGICIGKSITILLGRART